MRPLSRVLIVEDQEAVSDALAVLFEVHDIPCLQASGADEALRLVAGGSVGVVLQDMNFTPSAISGAEGSELFRAIRRVDPAMPVLLMTAWTSVETAVRLVREGAADYFAKPWDDATLLTSVRDLLAARALQADGERLRRERAEAREALDSRYDLRGLVYESEALHRVVALAVQVANADVPVLVTGPNGAGKEKIAEIVQANSRRREKPFVKVNVGALPDELLESELFGAEAGAYTGSKKLRIGRFEAADGGTLFLDEIGNLSHAGQVKLLRVLQTGEFERLGSSVTRRVDVRIVCATNCDLKKAIAEGRFREDLYFRLNVIELHVPPLTARRDDILPLSRSLLASLPGPARRLGMEAEDALLSYAWPGNIRELQNRIQRAALVATGEVITSSDLGLPAAVPGAEGGRTREGGREHVPSQADEAGRDELEALLVRHAGSVSRAAVELGISRQALYRKMERLGVVLERRLRS